MGLGDAFLQEPSRGVIWVSSLYGQRGGVNIFFGFSDNGSVWVKTGAGPQDEGFCKLFLLQTCASKRSN